MQQRSHVFVSKMPVNKWAAKPGNIVSNYQLLKF